jgi:hypothetical protein
MFAAWQREKAIVVFAGSSPYNHSLQRAVSSKTKRAAAVFH